MLRAMQMEYPAAIYCVMDPQVDAWLWALLSILSSVTLQSTVSKVGFGGKRLMGFCLAAKQPVLPESGKDIAASLHH